MTGEITTRPTLHRLTDEGIAIKALLLAEDLPDGDKDTLTAALDQIEGQWIVKVGNIANLILDWQAQVDVIKAEEDRLATMRRVLSNRVDRLSDYAMSNMIALGEEEGYTINGIVKIKVVTNPPSVEVIDEAAIPEAFLRIKQEVNKSVILSAFRAGEPLPPGVAITSDKKRLVVK